MVNLNNNVLTLDWEGPYTIKPYNIKSEKLFNEERPGLYLFTVKTNGSYSLHYIGMTTSLSSRIVEHLRNYISGRYYLYNSDKLKSNSKVTEYCLHDNYGEFFSNLEDYQKIARNLLESISFFLCPFDSFTIGIDVSENILLAESILIHHIFSDKHKKDFPIIDNSKRISPKIYECDLSIINKFPEGISVIGLMDEITAP